MNDVIIDLDEGVEYFSDLIQRHGREIPERPALREDDAVRTWAEYASTAARMANRLLAMDCGLGESVALLGRNTIAYCEAMAGVTTSGASIVPLPVSATPETIALMLNDCGARVLMVDEELKGLAVEAIKDVDGLHQAGLVGLDFSDDQFQDYQSWIGTGSDEPPNVVISPDDLFIIAYSSGTTGIPKGIMLSHGSRLAQAKTMAIAGYTNEAVNIISTPLFTYGAISTWMPTIIGGGTIVLVGRFDSTRFMELIEKYKVTHTLVVPVQFDRMLRVENFGSYDLSSMQFWFFGSAPMTVALKKQVVERFPGEMIEMYSLTEGGVTTALYPKHFPDKLASVGQPAGGCIIKIIDESDNELPVGEAGEIVGRGQLKMSGYLGKKALTDATVWRDKDGLEFLRSGDNGRLDEDGFLFLLDRKKDMIISGGFNIYASDIEAVIDEHPDIQQVTVIGAPSTKWGETPLAIVILEEGATTNEAELTSWANERLGKTQRIAHVEIRDEIPMNHLGKVEKRKLREELVEADRVFD